MHKHHTERAPSRRPRLQSQGAACPCIAVRPGLRRRRFAGLRASRAKQPPKEGVEAKERIAVLSNWRAVPAPGAPAGGEGLSHDSSKKI